ncbi:MAG: FeoC-like transcriptional regulator [SAR324 cluster bacterium]|nr:FeoC-like transcriptional regulator [SAR324 cluster bacterium]MBL7036051.1 FeoC-like transcriptional regulator [SAR324 cluster bacterium]
MIVSELSTYLKQVKQSAIYDLSLHFHSSPDSIRQMLKLLERKGRVQKLPEGSSCNGGCCKCETDTLEIYRWIGAG